MLTGREGGGFEPRAEPECTVLFHRLLVKAPSGTKRGGNHDVLHYGDEGVLRAKRQRVIDLWPERGFAITEKKNGMTGLKSTGQCWSKFAQRPSKPVGPQ